MPTVKKRKLRSDAPQRVKEMVNLFDPYFADARSRRVSSVNAGWKITWNVNGMDAASLACLIDMSGEQEDTRVELLQSWSVTGGWYVSILIRMDK